MIQHIKDLAKRTISDQILKDRYDRYQRTLTSMVFKFYKKTGLGVSVNEKLAKELHKSVIKKSIEEKSMQDVNVWFI